MASKNNQVIFDILANTTSFEKGMTQTVNVTEAATKAMKVGFIALSAAVVGSVVAFERFQKGLGNISTIIDNSTESINNIGEEILALSRKTPKPISELVESMYDIRSAGISAADSMEALNSAGRLATTGLATTKEATDILTTAMNSFKSEGLSSTEIANILFKTVKYGKNVISELSQAFGQTAPLAKAAGLSLVEFSAATASLTAQGIPASVAQNSIRAAMTGLQRGTKEMQKVFRALGEKDMKALIKNSKNLGDAFTKIYKKAIELDIPLQKVTGRVEGAVAITSLATEGAEVYTKALNDMVGGVDAVSEAFANQNSKLAAQSQLLQNIINETFITMGMSLEKGLFPLKKAATGLFETIITTIKANSSLIEGVFNFLTESAVSAFNIFKDLTIILVDFFRAFGGNQAFAAFGISLKIILVAIEGFVHLIKIATSRAVELLDAMGPLGTVFKVVAGGMLAMQAISFATFIWGIVSATKAWRLAMIALNFVMSINPIYAIAAAILALGLLIVDFVIDFNEYSMAFNKLTNSIAIGVKKVASLMASGQFKEILEKEIVALENENIKISDQIKLLKERKDQLKKEGKSSYDADAIAAKELASAKTVADEKKKIEVQSVADKEAITSAAAAKLRTTQQNEFAKELEYSTANKELLTEAEIAQLQANNALIEEEKEYARAIELENQGKHDEAMQKLRDLNEAKLIKNSKNQLALEKATQDAKLSIVANSIALVNALMGKETKAAFLASKALAAAQIIISSKVAEAAALALPPLGLGPVAGQGLASLIEANMYIQLATVAATTISGFATGTDYVPRDMMANIHEGEGIIPAKENQFLQSGKLSLVSSDFLSGANNNNNSSETQEVDVNINMSETLMDFIEFEVIKRRSLGVSRI